MTGIENEKLPTVEQVEQIISDWGKYTIDEFAEMFSLTREVVEPPWFTSGSSNG